MYDMMTFIMCETNKVFFLIPKRILDNSTRISFPIIVHCETLSVKPLLNFSTAKLAVFQQMFAVAAVLHIFSAFLRFSAMFPAFFTFARIKIHCFVVHHNATNTNHVHHFDLNYVKCRLHCVNTQYDIMKQALGWWKNTLHFSTFIAIYITYLRNNEEKNEKKKREKQSFSFFCCHVSLIEENKNKYRIYTVEKANRKKSGKNA